MLRKTLFGTTAMKVLQWGREVLLSSKYSKDTWEYISSVQSEAADGWKIIKGDP